VALIHPMRLCLMKGAHADLSSTAWQEIGVKPSVGLSGIMAVNVPLAVRRVHLRVTAYSSNEGQGFGRARQISLPMSALSVCMRTPLTSSVPKGQAKPVAFYGVFISFRHAWRTGSGTSTAIIPLKPTDGLNGAPSICCRCGKNHALVGLNSQPASSDADSEAPKPPQQPYGSS
jgi:hypothetical protein